MADLPNVIPIRLSDRDLQDSGLVANRLQVPRSTLIRQVWREWLDVQLKSENPSTVLRDSQPQNR